MKNAVVLSLAFVLASVSAVGRAEPEIVDITAAVRLAGAAAITTSTEPFDATKYHVGDAFDGVYPSSNTTGRWLVGQLATEADVEYVIDDAFEPGKSIVLKSVEVYRQSATGSSASNPISRAPKSWKVYGRNSAADGWTELGSQDVAGWNASLSPDKVTTELPGVSSFRQYRFEFSNPGCTDKNTRVLIAEIVLRGYVVDPSELEVGGVPSISSFSCRRQTAGAAILDWTVSSYGNFCTWADAKIVYADNEVFTDAVEVDLGRLTAPPPVSGSATVSELDPEETYYAKMTAVNQVDGTATSETVAFQALSFDPDVTEDDDLPAAVAAAEAKIAAGEAESVTLRVASGTYELTNPIVVSRPVSLVSVDGAEATRIVQSASLANVLTFAEGSSGAVLDGFTLVGSNWGTKKGSSVKGGNLSIQAGGVTVRNCVLTGATGGGQQLNIFGGGLYMNADSLVENCVISNNTTFKQGAGVYMEAGTVRNCRITENGRPTGGQYDFGLGSGAYVTGGLLTGCVIDRNRAHRMPGAGVVIYGADARVEQCTIVANDSPEAGAGVLVRSGTLSRSIVFGNTVSDLTWQNTNQLVQVCSPRLLTAGGHVWRNPGFVDFDAGDYRPAANSPVVLADGTYLGALAPGTTAAALADETPSEETEISVGRDDDVLAAVDDARRRIDAYGTPVTVRVAEGVFEVKDEILVDCPITLVGAGPERTVVNSSALMHRVISVSAADAVVSGVTFRGGASQGGSTGEPRYYFSGLGVVLSDGLVTNCTMTGVKGGSQNSVPDGGAVRQTGGHLVDCAITNNTATANGLGLYLKGGLAERLVVRGNTIPSQFASAAGVRIDGASATLLNSFICGNRMTVSNGKGGVGLSVSGKGVADGCTIVGNYNAGTEEGAGARIGDSGTLRNSILHGNLNGESANDLYRSSKAIVTYCSVPTVTEGEGNITGDPGFADTANGDYTLLLSSPCVDGGTNSQDGSNRDLAGNPRIVDGRLSGAAVMDIGCFEYVVSGEGLSVTFDATGSTDAVGSLEATFVAKVIRDGAVLDDESVVYRWTLGDGTVVEGQGSKYASVVHSYATPGARDVALSVAYGAERAELVREGAVRVFSDVICVAPPSAGVTGEFPYATPETAVSDLAEAYNCALAAAQAGAEFVSVRLLPGVHPLTTSFGMSFSGEVVGLGTRPEDVVVLPSAQLLAFSVQTDGSRLANLTVRGASRAISNSNVNGASVSLVADALVSNCVVEAAVASGHGASTYGHGLYASKGRVVDCTIRNCLDGGQYRGQSTVYLTGTAFADRLQVLGNRAGGGAGSATEWTNFGGKGAGVTVQGTAVLRNSLVAGNESGYCGGAGLYADGAATVENCTIVGNRIVNLLDGAGNPCNNAEHGAGLFVGDARVTVRNCIVWGNLRFDEAEDIAVTGGHPEYFDCVTYTLSPSLADRLVGTGNRTGDPLFKDAAAGNYRLSPRSPAIGAGFNPDWCADALDLDRRKRRRGRVEMGCYEATPGYQVLIR